MQKKHLVLTLTLLAFFLNMSQAEDAPTKEKIKVFLLAGQSNMDGRGDGSKLTVEDQERLAKAQEEVLFAYNKKPIAPLYVTDPAGGIKKKFKLEKTFGPELFFGIELSEAWPNQEILIIKRSIGGTSLYGCWNPEWTLEKAKKVGEGKAPKLYFDFVKYAKKVLSKYNKDDYEICAMLWVQGEDDSGQKYGPEPSEEYEENLKKLITSVRKKFNDPDLPFIMLEVGHGKVVEGMIANSKNLENVTFMPQNREDETAPNYLPGYGPPVGHYNYDGMKRIGEMFAEAYLSTYAQPTVSTK